MSSSDSSSDSDVTQQNASSFDPSDEELAIEPLIGDGNALLALPAPATGGIVDLASDDEEFEYVLPPVAPAAHNSASSSDDDLPVDVAARNQADDAPPSTLSTGSSRKRKRLRRGGDPSAATDVIAPALAAKREVIIKPQPTECTVCYDPCTSSGRHRLVSLKCGHVFGKKCIDRWVVERKTCPNCSVAVRKNDIRPLFSDHVAVVDNSGVEDMMHKCTTEKIRRIRVETELSRARLQLQLAQADVKKFQNEAAQWRKQVADLQCRAASERFTAAPAVSPTPTPTPTLTPASETGAVSQGYVFGSTQPLVSQASTLPIIQFSQSGGFVVLSMPSTPSRPPTVLSQAITPTTTPAPQASGSVPGSTYRELFRVPLQSSRVCAISKSCSFVCVGEALAPTTFGILKLSTADMRHAVRIAAHSSAVRDLSISPRDDMVLSVAWDGKLVVSNLHSNSVVMQYALPPNKRNAWSCSFSQVDPFRVYCGFHDGTIAQYDIRRPTTASDVVAFYELPARQPVHSLQLCPVMGGGLEQLVAGTFAGFGVWSSEQLQQPGADGAATRAASFTAAPNCCAISSSQIKPSKLVVTTRSQAPATQAKHNVYDLPAVVGSSCDPVLRSSLDGFRTPQAISRAAVWEERNGITMVASWDDECKRVQLWNQSTAQITARLPSSPPRHSVTPVVDVQHSISGGDWRRSRALLGLLSPQQLVVYAGSN